MKRRIGVVAALIVIFIGVVGIFRKRSGDEHGSDSHETAANNISTKQDHSDRSLPTATNDGSAGNLPPGAGSGQNAGPDTAGQTIKSADTSLPSGTGATPDSSSSAVPGTTTAKGPADADGAPKVGSTSTAPAGAESATLPGGERKRDQGSAVGSNNGTAAGKAGSSKGPAGSSLLAQNAAKDSSNESKTSTTGSGTTPTGKAESSPAALMDNAPKASVPEISCEEQWNQYVATFKVGADMVYMTSLSVQRPLASDITTSHIETVSQSTAGHVNRDIAFSSDHPSGILVLSSLNAAPSVSTSKSSFIAICQAAGGRAASSVLFKFASAKLIDIADEHVKVGVGTFPVYRMKFQAGLLMNEHVTSAIAEIWVAKNKMGLVVKQVIKLSPKAFPDHGSITISSQLAGMRKI